MFDTARVEECVARLRAEGSLAAPGFMKAEGVVCFHTQGNFGLKKTLEKDEEHKGMRRENNAEAAKSTCNSASMPVA
jgi:hypothetical protein